MVCLVVLLLLPRSALAQEPQIRFEHISLEQGLSHGTVFSMVQDQTGFIWFGTQSGLNRYDGYQITVFRHDPHDPNSISNDNAGNLFIDRQGIIWIGTWGGGLDGLNPETEEFTNYTHDPADPASLSADRVQTIFEDSTGSLWVGTSGGGLDKFDSQTQGFIHYRHNPDNPDSLSNDRVWRIVEDQAGQLWVATSDGLNRFDPQTETFTRYYHDPADSTSLGDSLVRTLYVDRSGVLWVGTETGLDRFDSQTESFTHYRHTPADPYSISDDIINAILEDSSGNFWVGTSRGGLNKFDRQSETFTPYLADPRRPDSLSHNDVRWILEDRSGVIWVATRGGGVNKFSPAIEEFRYLSQDPFSSNSLNNNDVRAIYEDQAGNLWIGTKGGGLNKYDAGTGRFSYFLTDPEDPTSLGHNDVYVIHQDRSGSFWLGLAGGGLNKFDPQTGIFTRYENDPADPNSLSNNDINSIYEDPVGVLWIGTKGGGLNRFDPQTETFASFQNDPADPASLGNDDVYEIYQEPGGLLWVSTYGGGLNLFDPETDTFTRYQYDPADPASLSNNDVYAIHRDRDDVLWIATANGGLNKLLPFSPDTTAGETNDTPHPRQFSRYTVADGLISDVVYAILEDEEGNLWLSTSKGLAKFDPDTETFVSYDASDGLESVGYHEGAYYKSASGEMFFGGINGLIRFYPAEIRENSVPPPVVLTSLSLPRHNMLLSKPLSQISGVVLSHVDDVFTFEFAALDYTNPAKNQFAYKLEGFDQDWISAGNRRLATYTNLDPGSYTFWVKAANNSGVWNETGTSIDVVVTPPFWGTWWFRTVALVTILGLAFTAYYVRISSIRAQQERLQILVDERTAELSTANANLRTLNDRLQLELKMAQEIERSLLPPPRPDWSGLDLLCYSASAREVGGDFYAYHLFTPAGHSGNGSHFSGAVQIPERKFAIAVGDASGKGMPAALLMAVSLASFQSTLDDALPPAELLAYLDEAIMPYTRTGNQNCSFCYLEITSFQNEAGWQMLVANAGCIPPFIRRAAGGSVEWLDVGGTPLGIGLGAEDGYQEVSLALHPGDLVILTSDGVVEAMTADREMFGFDRLQQAVAAGPTTGAEAMVTHLRQSVDTFTNGAEPHDDLTIVVIQI